MNDTEFALFMQYHFATCERGDMVGLTAHSLDIFKKGWGKCLITFDFAIYKGSEKISEINLRIGLGYFLII